MLQKAARQIDDLHLEGSESYTQDLPPPATKDAIVTTKINYMFKGSGIASKTFFATIVSWVGG